MKINKPLSAALAAAGLGYAIGNLNPAYVMGLRKGYDIRKKGSGNAGATNLMILEGKKAGAFVMCFDISKAAVSVGLARKLFLQSGYAGEAAGVGCILGHMYPALMHFRGGKGLACLGLQQCNAEFFAAPIGSPVKGSRQLAAEGLNKSA